MFNSKRWSSYSEDVYIFVYMFVFSNACARALLYFCFLINLQTENKNLNDIFDYCALLCLAFGVYCYYFMCKHLSMFFFKEVN